MHVKRIGGGEGEREEPGEEDAVRSLFEHRVEKQKADTLHKHDRSHALGIREKPGPVQSRTSRAADSLGQRVSVNKVVKERAYFEW